MKVRTLIKQLSMLNPNSTVVVEVFTQLDNFVHIKKAKATSQEFTKITICPKCRPRELP
jgi:hypothetical protein